MTATKRRVAALGTNIAAVVATLPIVAALAAQEPERQEPNDDAEPARPRRPDGGNDDAHLAAAEAKRRRRAEKRTRDAANANLTRFMKRAWIEGACQDWHNPWRKATQSAAAVDTLLAIAAKPPRPNIRHAVGCWLCGKPPCYEGARFCGAACSQSWEMGERPEVTR